MHVYFSTSPTGDVFGVASRKNWGQAELDTDAGVFPHWTWTDIRFGDWTEERRKDVNIKIPWVRTVDADYRIYSSLLYAVSFISYHLFRPSEGIFLHYGQTYT